MDREVPRLPELWPAGMAAADWPKRRAELVACLGETVYGLTPDWRASVDAQVLSENEKAYAGKALDREVSLCVSTPSGPFRFPVRLVLPKAAGALPTIVYISFNPFPSHPYLQVEEVVDRGYNLAVFCYNDITKDADDGFASGLGPLFPREGKQAWGKIGMWAWAASRVLDFALSLPQVHPTATVVAGHSRLGKTALWCAAQDERFACAVSNDSGCSGAALSRGNQGETVAAITRRFPYWFCEHYLSYGERVEDLPLDQHFLTAALAPRLLYVGSASEDAWADPFGEFQSAMAASRAWRLLGRKGLPETATMPKPGERLHGADVGYHLRSGTHFFSRYDWNQFMDFLDGHWRSAHPI